MTFGDVIQSFDPGFQPGHMGAKIGSHLYGCEFGADEFQIWDLKGHMLASRAAGNIISCTTDGKVLYGLVFSPKEVNAYDPLTLEKIRTLFTPTELGNPRGLGYTGKYFLISDEDTKDIFVYDYSGIRIKQISYPAALGASQGLEYRDGYLFIMDSGNKLIWLADLDGHLLKKTDHPERGDFGPGGIAVDGKYMWVNGRISELIYQCSVT